RQIEASRRHDQFVEKVIYHGLKNLSSGVDGESKWLFSAEDAEEIVRRCKNQGGKVRYISHVSESGEQDEFVKISWPTSAEKALQRLREKGRNEKFSVQLQIPEEVISNWQGQQ